MSLFRHLLLVLCLFISGFCYSAIVIKVRYNKCLLHLEGEVAKPGDYFQAMNLAGEPKGLVRLEKVKNGKSIGLIVEGVVKPNWILEKTYNKVLSPVAPVASPGNKNHPISIGGIVSLHQTNFFITRRGTGDNSEYSGFSGGFSGFFAWDINRLLRLKIALAYSCIKVNLQKGSTRGNFAFHSNQKNSTNSLCNMNWLDVRPTLSFLIPTRNPYLQPWLAISPPISWWTARDSRDHTHLISIEYMGMNYSLMFSAGIDWAIPKSNLYIPISINYIVPRALQRFRRPSGSAGTNIDHYSLGVGVATRF